MKEERRRQKTSEINLEEEFFEDRGGLEILSNLNPCLLSTFMAKYQLSFFLNVPSVSTLLHSMNSCC